MNKTEQQHELAEIDQELISRLNDVYNDADLEKRVDIKNMLNGYLEQLRQTKNVDLVLPLLCKQISHEYILNSNNFPKSVVELYFTLRMISSKHDSIEWSSMQAGLSWFE